MALRTQFWPVPGRRVCRPTWPVRHRSGHVEFRVEQQRPTAEEPHATRTAMRLFWVTCVAYVVVLVLLGWLVGTLRLIDVFVSAGSVAAAVGIGTLGVRVLRRVKSRRVSAVHETPAADDSRCGRCGHPLDLHQDPFDDHTIRDLGRIRSCTVEDCTCRLT